MLLLVYVYHPDATSLLVEELTELDEAVAVCYDLVAVDGYMRAEVWTEAGEQRYGVERVRGGTLRTYGVLTDGDEVAKPRISRDRAMDVAVALEREAVPDDLGPGTGAPPAILGELPDRPERWFGA